MKGKFFVAFVLAILIQIFSINIAFAETEDIESMERESGIGSGTMIIPLQGPLIVTSPQGWRIHPIYGDLRYHAGCDLGGDYGMTVIAAQAGEVVYSGWISGYGNSIIIDHGGGLTSLYGHNQ